MRYLCHVMISIIIPLYNKGELIGRTLRSIAAQENVPVKYEVVVVDDGSTDGCADIARRVATEIGIRNFRVLPQTNAGVGAARNRGIAEARGEYVAFLDADDIWKPSHLSMLAEAGRKVSAMPGMCDKLREPDARRSHSAQYAARRAFQGRLRRD